VGLRSTRFQFGDVLTAELSGQRLLESQGGGAMLEFVAKAKQYIWDFIELGFAALLAIMLIYLVLGQDSGVFILFVAGNVIKFTNDVPAGNLLAFAIIAALLYWVAQKNGKASVRAKKKAPAKPEPSTFLNAADKNQRE
jgi:hypothetical protein